MRVYECARRIMCAQYFLLCIYKLVIWHPIISPQQCLLHITFFLFRRRSSVQLSVVFHSFIRFVFIMAPSAMSLSLLFISLHTSYFFLCSSLLYLLPVSIEAMTRAVRSLFLYAKQTWHHEVALWGISTYIKKLLLKAFSPRLNKKLFHLLIICAFSVMLKITRILELEWSSHNVTNCHSNPYEIPRIFLEWV